MLEEEEEEEVAEKVKKKCTSHGKINKSFAARLDEHAGVRMSWLLTLFLGLGGLAINASAALSSFHYLAESFSAPKPPPSAPSSL